MTSTVSLQWVCNSTADLYYDATTQTTNTVFYYVTRVYIFIHPFIHPVGCMGLLEDMGFVLAVFPFKLKYGFSIVQVRLYNVTLAPVLHYVQISDNLRRMVMGYMFLKFGQELIDFILSS